MKKEIPKRKVGRPKIWKDNAAKQKAYRMRKKVREYEERGEK